MPMARLYLPQSRTPFPYGFIGGLFPPVRIKGRKGVDLVNSVILAEEVGLGYRESVSRPCEPVVVRPPL